MAPSTDGKRCRLLVLPEAVVCRKGASQQQQGQQQQAAGGVAVAVEAGQILALAHPRGGPRPAQYLLSPQGQLCELQAFRPSGMRARARVCVYAKTRLGLGAGPAVSTPARTAPGLDLPPPPPPLST